MTETTDLWLDVTLGDECIGGLAGAFLLDAEGEVVGITLAGVPLPPEAVRAILAALDLSAEGADTAAPGAPRP